MISPAIMKHATTNTGISKDAADQAILTLEVGIAKAYNSAFTTAVHPTQTNCTIEAPQYVFSEAYERSLMNMPNKKIVYNDFKVTEFKDIKAGESQNLLLQESVSRPRYALIYPFLAASVNGYGDMKVKGSVGAVYSDSSLTLAPYQSPFSSAPGTVTPYIQLTGLNVQVASNWIYKKGVNMTYQKFQEENRKTGVNNGQTLGMSNGLISEADYYAGYGIVYLDLSDHPLIDDAVRGQIVFNFTNSSEVTIDCVVVVAYERNFELNLSKGELVSKSAS